MSPEEDEDEGLGHLRQIATPSRFAMAKIRGFQGSEQSLSKAVTGFDFVLYWWLKFAERRILDAVMSPERRYIILNVPPRAGKTTYSGVFLPAWFLGMFPAKRVMFVTYSDDYSVMYGRAVRTILDKFGQKFFGVGVDRSAQSASDWKMANSFGGMLSTGVGGVLTGFGGDLIVVDDIIKNIQEARSQATKRMHEQWFDTTLLTRLEPGGTIIITATRWAEDDISGVLIERMKQPGYRGPKWEVIDMPALAEPIEGDQAYSDVELEAWRDELGRKYGESLNPERVSAEEYAMMRDSGMDAFLWSCLYQQRPSSPTGGMFPRASWKQWNPANLPAMGRRVRVWDLATTEDSGDWTVGVLMGRASGSGDLYVLERERFRRGTGEVEMAVKAVAARDGFGVPIFIEQEKAGAGKALVEHYQRMLAGYMVEPAKLDGSKEQRATPYSIMQQQGRVWIPGHESWIEEWVKEHQGMLGNGIRPRHDDQIDTAAYAARELLGDAQVELFIPGNESGGFLERQAQALLSEELEVGSLLGQPV